MERGFVKLWRRSIDSAAFADPVLWKLWCLCLMKANHKTNYVPIEGIAEPVKVTPGQFITGRFALHKEMYPRKKKNQKSPSTIWNKLQILQNMRNLNIRSHAKYSIITISNWEQYQQNEQQANNRLTTGEQPANTNKNDKNEKNIKDTSPGSSKNGECPYQEIVALYHEILPELPEVLKITEPRKKQIKARWKNDLNMDLEEYRRYFKFVRQYPFLMGIKQGCSFKASLEWLTKESNFTKVIEGFYDQNKR